MEISSDEVNAPRISTISFLKLVLPSCESSRYVSPLNRVAVVSVPATMKRLEFAFISALVRPLPLSSDCNTRSQRSTPSESRPFSKRFETRVLE